MVAILIHSQVYTYFLKHSKSAKSNLNLNQSKSGKSQNISVFIKYNCGLICDHFFKDLISSSGTKQIKIMPVWKNQIILILYPDPVLQLAVSVLRFDQIERLSFKQHAPNFMAGKPLSSSQLLLLARYSWFCIAIIYMSCYLASQLICCVYQYKYICIYKAKLSFIMGVTYPSCTL